MMTVNEVSNLTGVSIRTLQYYDKIGLLNPTGYTDSGYRLYDDMALETLQQILLFRELEFPLKEIKQIMYHPGYNKKKALEQQIELLVLRREHLEKLIAFACEIKENGGNAMNFEAFDTSKMDEYARNAKEQWGNTKEYKESVENSKNRSKEKEMQIADGLMEIFKEFGGMKENDAASEGVQKQVKKLQDYITENYYACSDEILSCLGQMYVGGGEMTDNINAYGGEGTATFVEKAISAYCGR